MSTPVAEINQPLRIEGVSKAFGTRQIHQGLHAHVDAGEILAVVGPSGIGKSVLLRLVAGLMPVDDGHIFVQGQDLVAKGVPPGSLGFLFQHGALIDGLSVFDNVMLSLRRAKENRRLILRQKEDREQVLRVLEQLSLADVRHKFGYELPTGTVKRAALARAVVAEPALLLYDEPTTAVDPILAREVREMIVRVRSERSGAVLVTHDIPLVRAVADRVLMMAVGGIMYSGDVRGFLESEDERVQAFIHGKAMPSMVTD